MSDRDTKETQICKHSKCKLLCVFLSIVVLCGSIISNTLPANAATLSVHNYITNDTYDYTGAQVRYKVNNESITTNYPGIILSNGAAVGPFSDVFGTALGVSTDYNDKKTSFSITYGPYTIKMTLGNTTATVNGVKKTMNNPPFVYSFNNQTEKHLYVPTRFVAETLGFDYVWDAKTSTVSITRPNVIYDGKTQIKYTGTQPKFWLNNSFVSTENYPGYVFDGVVFFSAEEYFKNTGMASFAYAEGSGLIILKNEDTMVRMVLDSPVAYINDTPHILQSVPRLITPQNESKASVYIPAEFVAKALGYTASYNKSDDILCINGTLPEPGNAGDIKPDGSDIFAPGPSSFEYQIFTYQTHPQLISYYTQMGQTVPEEFSAFACKNSDALYLKGVDYKKVKITDKYDLLEIDIIGYQNPFGSEICYLPDESFLNYCYLNESGNFKIIVRKEQELLYYSYAVPDGCVIHFTDINGMYADSLDFNGNNDNTETDSDSTDIFSGTDLSGYLPEAVFSRDYFVIRLPESATPTTVTDSDEYEKKRFTISIPGNHMSFLSEQDTYNPIATLKNVQFSYKVANDTTVITFNTTKIQGYSFLISGGYLAVKIDNPSKIYDKIIVLDAGHGGIDPGTLRGSVYEKNVNFNVINVYAKEYFKDSDIKVYFTRTTDTKIALQTRADFAATVEADLFISFHVNAHSNASVNGTSVYYSTSNNSTVASGLKSSILASSVVNHLSNAWGTKNKGVLSDKFVVIHKNTVPAVLVECGFITNNNDFQKIKDTAYQKKAAKAIFDAVSEIFEKYPTKR